MAFVNLLNGSYSGVMGQTVGVKHKKKPVVRSRVFSKAPMTAAQKTALTNYIEYNQMISPRIRALIDSGYVKDKTATAWAFYRKLFKYAIGKTPPYPNCYQLAPPAEPRLITSVGFYSAGSSGYLRKMTISPEVYPIWPKPDFPIWFLGILFPQGYNDTTYKPYLTCQKANKDNDIIIPESAEMSKNSGCTGIIFQPQGNYLKILDAWQYCDQSGVK